MIKLSRYLGFGAQHANEVIGGRITDEATEKILKDLLKAEYDHPIALTNLQRRNVLDLLIGFYADHLENMSELRSVQVLREVLG